MNDAHPLLTSAFEYCKKLGYRYTEPRAQVLRVLLEEKKPLGAYAILQKLSIDGNQPKPPTIYRAIHFWQQEGFIHSIESLNAYVACLHGHHMGLSQFLICDDCDYVEELESKLNLQPLHQSAQNLGFQTKEGTLEMHGVCANCAK